MSENKGFLCVNDKIKPSSPDYTGKINIDGINYSISAWENTSRKTGAKYLNIKVNPVGNSTVSDFSEDGEF
ncbi:MAG TPA: hypothetical protein PK079_24045 [Leptospiraceae bacterium]|nr:hypothetical protein [Leptospiraceae bacterium]HMZ66484.1 hypothetical protein [Leptospiraceae bacterium]HNA10026.1 hypothetical protein [Leptospiraceae bacterium]HNC00255.1 hypothetical protein [Leptospiraceae bacterium]HNC59389.1 hypothetical protein [Leptospiraceae bacterium]